MRKEQSPLCSFCIDRILLPGVALLQLFHGTLVQLVTLIKEVANFIKGKIEEMTWPLWQSLSIKREDDSYEVLLWFSDTSNV
jgi:hypothetical protein